MLRRPGLLAALILAGSARLALAQEPPSAPPEPASRVPGVEVSTLAAPDAFSTAGRDTGLPKTLWRGTSVATAGTVLPLLAAKPLSPAAAALARRVLATGASGPQGTGQDAGLAGARANALIAQGDAKAAAAILGRAPGVDRSPELARAAAESALLAGDDARACAVAEGLSAGREETYWLRLRTYCQAIAGQTAQAQLTFELAQAQSKDPVFARLMTAKLAGSGNPGPPSLRNGLDFALSHSLGLDLGSAKASPAVAAALSDTGPEEPLFDAAAASPDVAILVDALMKGDAVRASTTQALLEAADPGLPPLESKARARRHAAALLAFALSGPLTAETRGQVAALTTPEGKAPVGRDIALEAAADQKLMGEVALLSLWTCAEAGAAGPAMGDRVRIVRALHAVGLEVDARAMALEGLLALK